MSAAPPLSLWGLSLLLRCCFVGVLLSLLNCCGVQLSCLGPVFFIVIIIFWHDNSTSSNPRLKLSFLFDTTTTCHYVVGVAGLYFGATVADCQNLLIELSHAVSETLLKKAGAPCWNCHGIINILFHFVSEPKNFTLLHWKEDTMKICANAACRMMV